MFKYNHIAVGGTFDRLHKGHKELLSYAISLGKTVTIGLASDDMSSHKQCASTLLPYKKRLEELQAYLGMEHVDKSVTITKITDPLGTLNTDHTIEAVVVGPTISESVLGEIRSDIAILTYDVVHADDSVRLSSSRIRTGEIDRSGKLYPVYDTALTLPRHMRAALKSPLGPIVESHRVPTKSCALVYSVGDESTQRLVTSGTLPHVSIVDLHVQRKKKYADRADLGFTEEHIQTQKVSVVEALQSPAGSISAPLFSHIKQATTQALSQDTHTLLILQGEDDLATLACIQVAPLGSIVYYGQPNQGLVEVLVTEEKKDEVRGLLIQFLP